MVESAVANVQAAPKPEISIGWRHVIIFLLFLSTTVSYATRVSMSMAIVAMTTDNQYGFQVFDWDRTIQDTVLSSFFWGYILLQIPAGMLAGKFGGKYLVFGSMVVTGAANLVVPVAATHGIDTVIPFLEITFTFLGPLNGIGGEPIARPGRICYTYCLRIILGPAVFLTMFSFTVELVITIYCGWIAVCACRIVMGLAQGLLYPSLHGLLGQWAPASERSRMGTIVYAGAQLGTIIEMMTAGVLSASPWGWPSVFYVAGITCLLWAGLWIILGSSSPGTHRWITKEERKYVEYNAASADISQHKSMPTPWKAIFTSLPFWAIILAHSGQSLGFWTLLTEMPSYMSKVLGVDIKSNGMLSALPYVAMYILSFIFSWMAETLVNRNIITLGTSRKIFNTIAFWGPGAALLVLSYLPAGNLTLAVVILTITVGLNGAHYVGFLISHIDLSPNFASTLMGITNGCGNIFSIMAPLSVSFVVKDETLASDWRKVFFISVAFYFLSNLFYLLFMSDKVQEWNELNTTGAVEDGIKQKRKSDSSKNNTMGEEKF